MKSKLKFLAKLLGVLLLVLILGLAVYVWRSFPKLSGESSLQGLSAPVSIKRDAADVTHIEGKTDEDVYRAMGYTHAQERSWQLEFNRRVMHGELSAVFGAATLDIDKLMRTLGVVKAAKGHYEQLPEHVKRAFIAYTDGINSFHANSSQALPPEFHVLGVKPSKWNPEDSVAWGIIMSLDLSGNWGNEFARFSALQKLSTDQLWEFMPPYPGEERATKTDLAKLYKSLGVYAKTADPKSADQKTTSQLLSPNTKSMYTAWAEDWLHGVGDNNGKGSNNWVISGNKTESGKPLLANDPHLALSAPAIWYFARQKSPNLDVMGATLPGTPFVVLGRTQNLAWGFTNVGSDVQDLYLEQINPENPKQYRVPAIGAKPSWADFETRDEIIKVKGQGDIKVTVRSTRHGPVISDAQKNYDAVLNKSKYAMSLRWASLDKINTTALANYKANRVNTVAGLRSALADFQTPPQNVVMADAKGETAYQVIGVVVKRSPQNDLKGMVPALGWEAKYDWTGYLPYAQNPAENTSQIAARGYRATANQRIHDKNYPHFMGQDWVLPYRQDRIDQLLSSTTKHNAQTMRSAHADTHSEAALKLKTVMQRIQSDHPMAKAAQLELAKFKGVNTSDGVAPSLINVWADVLTRSLMSERLGVDKFKTLYGKRHFRAGLEDILDTGNAAWCSPKTCEERYLEAFDATLNQLSKQYGSDISLWTWGKLNTSMSSHKPFGNVGALRPFFSVRSISGSDPYSVNVAQYHLDQTPDPYANRHAASLRAVYDLADLEQSQFIYQTGQSGLVFSSRYKDMAQDWSQVKYRALQMNPKLWSSELVLNP